MNRFSESHLDSLEPGDQVYEIEGANDFAFRVFPNGSKTWVFISTEDGYVRRQTLGIYPDTGIRQALHALQMARAAANGISITKETQSDKTKQRAVKTAKAKRRRSRLRGKTVTATAIIALSVGGLLTLHASQDLSSHNLNPEHHLAPITGTIAVRHPDTQTAAGKSGDRGTTEPSVEGSAAQDQMSVVDIGSESSEVDARDISGAQQLRSPSESSQTAFEQSSSQEFAGESPVRSGAAVLKVKRAQFTTGIANREPVDRVGLVWDAWEDGEERRLIYFFTELGGMNARTAYHRWELNGRIVSEIPFEVKSSWRWRVFSSKTLLPTMTGLWRVTVVDDQGNSLHSESLILPASERFAISR